MGKEKKREKLLRRIRKEIKQREKNQIDDGLPRQIKHSWPYFPELGKYVDGSDNENHV